jgi:hypothetical protein
VIKITVALDRAGQCETSSDRRPHRRTLWRVPTCRRHLRPIDRRGVAGRQHHTIGIEFSGSDLRRGQEPVIIGCRLGRRGQHQCRLGQTLQLARHEPMSGELDDLYRSAAPPHWLACRPAGQSRRHLAFWRSCPAHRRSPAMAEARGPCRHLPYPPDRGSPTSRSALGRSARQHGITDAEERGRSVLRIRTGALPIELHLHVNNLTIAERRLLPRLLPFEFCRKITTGLRPPMWRHLQQIEKPCRASRRHPPASSP